MDILIKNNSDEAIYHQIYEQIKQQILNGQLKPGTSLPSIRLLAKSLKVSVITVKRAYQELGNDGFIETSVGRGSFVCEIDESVRKKELENLEEKINLLIKEAKEFGLTLEEYLELTRKIWTR